MAARAQRVQGRLRRLMRDSRGGVAVELAMISLPVILLMCTIMDAAILVFAQQSLDVSLEKASRALRTGEFQKRADGSDPTTRLRLTMCGSGLQFFNCGDLRLDLASAGSFTTARLAEPYNATKRAWSDSFGTRFECPTGGDVVTLRVAVTISRIFSILSLTSQPMPGDRQLLVATSVFRTENYATKPCT